MSDPTWYEHALNERGLTIMLLRARIGQIRAAAAPLRQLSAALAAGFKHDQNEALESINALLREIDREPQTPSGALPESPRAVPPYRGFQHGAGVTLNKEKQ
jgi:hypothetical protein